MRRGDGLPKRDLLQPRSCFLLLLLKSASKGSARPTGDSMRRVDGHGIVAENTLGKSLMLLNLRCTWLRVVLGRPIRIAM